MSQSFHGSCPWTTLGLQPGASPEHVRDAYRKLALRWHPDQNSGCAIAREQFHRIKDAFEHIKAIQSKPQYRTATNTYNRSTTSSQSSARYRYKRPYQSPYDDPSSFYDFRQDARSRSWNRPPHSQSYSSPYEYARAQAQREKRANFKAGFESLRKMYLRSRVSSSIGLGIGVACFVSVCGTLAFASNTIWRVNNRGKSFDELMKTLDDESHPRNRRRLKRHPT